MVAEDVLSPNLINTLKEAAFYNKNRFQELMYEDYPYTTSRDFIKTLTVVHKGILENLVHMEKNLGNGESFEERSVEIQRYGQTLSSMHDLLQILEMGRREYVPEGIVVLIHNLMKASSSNARFLLLPAYDYNFMYVELIGSLKITLKDVLEETDSVLGTTKFAIFWFPLAHKDNAMLNALLAHEFGHFLADDKKIVEKLMGKIKLDQFKIQEIAQEILKVNLPAEKGDLKMDNFFGLDTTKAQVIREVSARTQSQLKELVSDSIGFHLFGPAFITALISLLLTLSNMDVEPKGYPSAKIRIRFLIDEFEKQGYIDSLRTQVSTGEKTQRVVAEEFRKYITDWKKKVKDDKPQTFDKISLLVRELILSIKEEIGKEVSAITGAYEFTSKEFEIESFKLLDKIDSFVPPTEMEIEVPANPIAILNAGMLYELTIIENLHRNLGNSTDEEKLQARHTLHKLIMKAIETSQIQKTMKEIKKQI
jgi:hypothetical protein